ncbi:ribosome maturation factor [Parasponia andersonii]|uniref:Ribosome maturation factor n=1 Tax=Parasponia andersonii TaxID=3476 RepID=A0A2P5B8U9_PARAD|nr:ribosome maturation factor [Parasponia andersonii]
MATTKPLTTEAIALTEKKMDMTLDDIIKMEKSNNTKPKKQQRVSNKSQNFVKNAGRDKSSKVRRYVESKSSVRQGVLAQRRSNYHGNQFALATEVARKAASVPLRNRAFSYNQVANWKARVAAPPVQRRPGNGRFASKPPQQQQQGTAAALPKQRPQTLDSLFANMKEERMRILSQKNNGVQRNRVRQQRPPWGRGRFGTNS